MSESLITNGCNRRWNVDRKQGAALVECLFTNPLKALVELDLYQVNAFLKRIIINGDDGRCDDDTDQRDATMKCHLSNPSKAIIERMMDTNPSHIPRDIQTPHVKENTLHCSNRCIVEHHYGLIFGLREWTMRLAWIRQLIVGKYLLIHA